MVCITRSASLRLDAELVPSLFLTLISGVEATFDKSNATRALNKQNRRGACPIVLGADERGGEHPLQFRPYSGIRELVICCWSAIFQDREDLLRQYLFFAYD